MKKISTIYSLAKLIASEWMRLKFFHIVLFFGIGFIGFSHLLSSLTFSVQERLLYDFGLGSLELGLIMVASMIGSHTIQREIDRKTMFVILARPIPRSFVIVGAWGAIATGIFAAPFINSLGTGALYGNPGQILTQIIGVLVVVGYTFIMTILIAKVIDKTMGLRVDLKEEVEGLDTHLHEESGYRI